MLIVTPFYRGKVKQLAQSQLVGDRARTQTQTVTLEPVFLTGFPGQLVLVLS